MHFGLSNSPPASAMAPPALVCALLTLACPMDRVSLCDIAADDRPSVDQLSHDDPLPALPSNPWIMSRGPTDAKHSVADLVASSEPRDSYSSVILNSFGLLATRLKPHWLDLWSRSPVGTTTSWTVAHWLASGRLSRMLLVLLVLAPGADAQAVSEVRIGGLFPLDMDHVGVLAAFVMAVQEINNSTELLPDIQLR
jgi:hypothetical protein